MKNPLFIPLLLLMLVFSVCGWAELPQVNSYGVFRDNRFSEPYLRAYWFGQGGPGEMIVGVRSINLDTNQSHNSLALYLRTASGAFDLIRIEEPQENRGSPLGQGVEEVLLFVELVKDSEPNGNSWVQFTGVDNRIFQAYFPLLAPMFGFTALYDPDETEPIYYLERTGSLSQENLGTFFSFGPTPSFSGTTSGMIPLPGREKVTTTLRRAQISIDSHWRRLPKAPDILALGFYSNLDAQITVESYEKTSAAVAGVNSPSEFLAATVFRRSGELEYSSYFVRERDQGIQLGAFVQIRPGVWNYQEYKIWELENDFLVVNFFSLADAYWVNRRYFRDLLDSIHLVDR